MVPFLAHHVELYMPLLTEKDYLMYTVQFRLSTTVWRHRWRHLLTSTCHQPPFSWPRIEVTWRCIQAPTHLVQTGHCPVVTGQSRRLQGARL